MIKAGDVVVYDDGERAGVLETDGVAITAVTLKGGKVIELNIIDIDRVIEKGGDK